MMASALSCTKGHRQPGASGQTAEQPRHGGTLIYAGGNAGSADIIGYPFDPAIPPQSQERSYSLFYERLLAYNLRTYAIEPELAQKWEQPSPAEYVFHLQPGVKWQNKPPVNGRPLAVDDIIWTFNRARSNDPKFVTRSYLALVDKIEAPDTMTIRLTTTGPDVSTLQKLAVDNLAVLAREALEKYPKPTTANAVVGTGAFMMKSVEQGVGAEYIRNPDYWKPGLPYLDGFHTKAFSDYLTAWAAFQSGQVDVALMPGSEVKKYIAQQGAGYQPDWYADDTVSFMYPNTKVKPMDDERITRALRLLTDHDEFIKAWAETQYGRGRYGSIFPTALSAWDLTDEEYRGHVEWKQPKDEAAHEALAMLDAAGFNKASPLKFTLLTLEGAGYPEGAQLLQAQWKRLSQGVIDVQLKLSDGPTASAMKASGAFTYMFVGGSTGTVDPDSWLSTTYRGGGSENFTGFSDSTLDAMIDKQRALFDEKQRRAAVREIILYAIDHLPSVIPANRYELDAVQPRVHGHVPEYKLNGRLYQSVWISE